MKTRSNKDFFKTLPQTLIRRANPLLGPLGYAITPAWARVDEVLFHPDASVVPPVN